MSCKNRLFHNESLNCEQSVTQWPNPTAYINPRPGSGGGSMRPPPPEVFVLCTPNYESDRAEILDSVLGVLCATFSKKSWPGHVR